MDFISSAMLLQFILACSLIELTPGPNMGYLAILSATHGRRSGIAAVAGVALGLLIVGVAAALGLAAIIAGSPFLYQVLRWGGVAYMMWLAWEGWIESDDPITATDHEASNYRKFFTRGLITNLLNPKAGLFYIAIIPTFVDQSRSIVFQTLTLSIVFVVIATAIHLTIVMLAGNAERMLQDSRRSLIVRRIFSVLLGGVAIWIGWSTRA